MAGNNCPDGRFEDRRGGGLRVQAQTGLAACPVEAVAGEAVLRQDREHVAVVSQLIGGQRLADARPDRQQNRWTVAGPGGRHGQIGGC